MPKTLKIFIGTSGWNYSQWQYTFYPRSVAQKKWLEYYVTQFNTVEVNATFYRSFENKIYNKWRETASSQFKFILKVPHYISHIKLLQNVDREMQNFFYSATQLKNKLGLILLQLPPRMPLDLIRLEQAIKACPNP